MTLIDLGEVTHDATAPAIPLNLRRLVTLMLALVALAGTSALAGSARPAPPTVRTLWTAPLADDETALVDTDTAYLNRQIDGRTELTAYDLATGEVRWTTRTGAPTPNYGPNPVGGLVFVPIDQVVFNETDPDGSYWTTYNRTTVALDAATGIERWRTAGEIGSIANDDGLGLVREHTDRGALVRFRLIRLSDGRDLWNVPTPGVVAWTVTSDDDRPADIVTVTAAGEVTLIRFADGVLRRSGRLPWPAGSELFGAGPYLAVQSGEVPRATTTVYRPADLGELWRTGDDIGYVTGCGPVLCTVGRIGVDGRDPETGQVRWRLRGMNGVRPVAPGRLLLDDGGPTGNVQLVDALTGRALGRSAFGTTAWGAPQGSILLLRPTQAPAGRVAVVRLVLATGDQKVLGAIGRIGDQFCTGTTGYLACARDGTLTVTAVD